ncbi:MAG: hypothetical protein ACP5R4_05835, partial [Armatimonadota bacterium]
MRLLNKTAPCELHPQWGYDNAKPVFALCTPNKIGSLSKLKDRTFRAVFEFPPRSKAPKSASHKALRLYRNPI